MVFFFEQGSVEEMNTWLQSGQLEVTATDALFQDGSVAILATDAGTAQKFTDLFESVQG